MAFLAQTKLSYMMPQLSQSPNILSAGISSSAEQVAILTQRYTHNSPDRFGSIRA
jgi:hypothetical protein